MILDSKIERTLGGKLWVLIVGRLAAAVLLLIASALWTSDRPGTMDLDARHGTVPLFVAVVSLSAMYAVARRFSDQLRLQAAVQLIADVALVTWLVWATGDVT